MSRLFCSLSFLIVVCISIGQEALQPPVAPVKPKQTAIHGETLVDNYFYIREKENPEVIEYLNKENAYTQAVMLPTKQLQEKLYQEFLSHIKQTDLSVPTCSNGYWYYERTKEGQQYPLHCRKKGSVDSNEEIMLDVNELAKPYKFYTIESTAVSFDNRYLAFAADTTGFRQYALKVKDLTTGQFLPDTAARVHAPQWSADGKYLFYIVEDEQTKRSHRLYRQELGNSSQPPTLLYDEKDELFELELSTTLDRKYLVLTIGSSESTEVRVLSTGEPKGEWAILRPREEKHRYYLVGHRNDHFYLKSNKDAKNFKLLKTSDKERGDWVEVLPHRPDTLVESVAVFQDHMVIDEKYDGLDRLVIYDVQMNPKTIKMNEPTYGLAASLNAEFQTNKFRYAYTSFVTPASILEYDLASSESKLLKEQEVPGGYDRKKYVTERVWITARDGVKVPVSLVYQKGLVKDGSAPCLLTGYGAYGSPSPASFSETNLSLLDRGFVFALAHIRGGNEMGEPWHDDGKMLKKKNTFFDFIDAGNWLCDQKYTSHDKLAIKGGSAGGLLIGASLHLAGPGFCKTAILDVPFVDVINTMLNETIPLTFPEFLEWGNPKLKDQYDYMKTYCPYTNMPRWNTPAMLVLTSLNDSQVMYWEPTKYVAKLRTVKQGNEPLLLKCNMNAGHGGASGRYDSLKEEAFSFAFILWQIGIKE